MTKITFVSDMTKQDTVYSHIPELKDYDVKLFTLSDSDNKILASASDTDYLVADAMATISDKLISGMKSLKLIISEGVGYQGIDINSAKRNGVIVCNNKGVNNTAVAEHTVMLILNCLKDFNNSQIAVLNGKQIEAKKSAFGNVKELSECTVGLVGFGDIAKATATILKPFGCKILYSNRTRYEELEKDFGVEYAEIDDLLKQSDFVSLHISACAETNNLVDSEFLSKMKKDAFLINTSRGKLVNNEALLNALLKNEIAGAGLDVIDPEPVQKDNALLDERIIEKLTLTPHIAGITRLTVKKIYRQIYQNIINHINGDELINIVG